MAHVSEFRGLGTSLPARLTTLRADLSNQLAQYRTYRRTLRELNLLSVRELNDIGLNRHALRQIAYETAYGAA